MQHCDFELVAVAFVRSTGGRVRVLLAVDRDGDQLFDGDPALLVEHRPGAPIEHVALEGPDGLAPERVASVRDACAAELVGLVEGSFADDGSFDASRMLGRSVAVRLVAETFDMG